jgi:hypothetical protein
MSVCPEQSAYRPRISALLVRRRTETWKSLTTPTDSRGRTPPLKHILCVAMSITVPTEVLTLSRPADRDLFRACGREELFRAMRSDEQ